MKNVRKFSLILILAVLALALSGCQESKSASYEKAQSLMADGKYEEAGKKFEELGSYEESAKLSMYCKAAAAGEKGDYETSVSTFQLLGGYKESSFMIPYYNARELQSRIEQNGSFNWWEAIRAAEAYDAIALFRDSKTRAEECRRKAYDYAVQLAQKSDYQSACSVLDGLGEYSDSRLLSRYYWAFYMEQCSDYMGASYVFSDLALYKDAKDQATKSLERGYKAAEALEASGDQEGAYEMFMKLATYSDSYMRANKPYYDLGVAKRASGEWDEAVAAFEHAGTYSDASQQILATRYAEGEAKRTAYDWDGAVKAFSLAGDYEDAADQISATRYAEAEWLLGERRTEEAATVFKSLGEYKDSKELSSELYSALGDAYLAAQDWDAAIIAYTLSSGEDSEKTVTGKGFMGDISVTVSLSPSGTITSLSVDASNETPGLGSRVMEEEFIDQFIGKRLPLTLGVDIDAFTAATFTSQAVIDAINGIEASTLGNPPNDKICEVYYQKAKSFENEKKYKEAYQVYSRIKGYRDVDRIITGDIYTDLSLDQECSSLGFGGLVTVKLSLLGKTVIELSIDTPNETTGLGAKASEEAFTGQFIGKEGPFTYGENDIEAITGATVTSTAVLNAINSLFSGEAAEAPAEESAPAAQPAEGDLFVPGTYVAEAQGLLSKVTVGVTVDAKEIVSVLIDASGETPELGGVAAGMMSESIQKAQTPNVDTVSGATVTSKAIIEAATKALTEAGADIAVLDANRRD